MIKCKINVYEELKKKGYNTTVLQRDYMSSTATTKLKKENTIESIKILNVVCSLLNCQPSKLLAFVPDNDNDYLKKTKKNCKISDVENISKEIKTDTEIQEDFSNKAISEKIYI